MINVHSIETFGTHDGPGIRLVVFLQGCPIRCVYCHNPDTLSAMNEGCKSMSAEEIVALLEKEKPYFKQNGGLTVSGGEPTFQARELLEVFEAVKKAGFNIALDTNGVIFSDDVHKLYDLADLVILDVKHIDTLHHKKVTGMGNEQVLKNAEYREKSGKKMWLRYVLVPGWTDQPEFLEKWAQHFKNYKTVERVELLPYHTLGVHKYEALGIPYKLEGLAPPTAAAVDAAAEVFKRYLPNVVIA
jgi:pyruvate formate lyase activating enzyme